MKSEPGIERAIELGLLGPKPGQTLITKAGEPHNPYSYGVPCYWAWHGANEARKHYEGAAEERQLVNSFEAGLSCAKRGGYLSDNPHTYETPRWQSWKLGFEEGKNHEPSG